MKTIVVILFAIAIPATFALIIWKLLFGLKSSLARNILIALAIIVALILESLFIVTSKIPSKADTIFSNTVQLLENELDSYQPGLKDQIIDKQQLTELLKNRKQIDKFLESNSEINFIVKHTMANAFLENLEEICGDLEGHIAKFEETQTPFTLSNIFTYTLEEVKAPILWVAKVFEIIIVVISILAALIVLFLWLSIKKGWLEDGVNNIKEETQETL